MARAQSGRALSGARTMPRWLWVAVSLTLVHAWNPPELLQPALSRVSRDLHTSGDHTHTVHIHGWTVQLQENFAIRTPYDDQCHFYKGRVFEVDDSFVVITECKGQLYGLIQVSDKEFILQPTEVPRSSHVLRRRDISLTDGPPVFNLTGDTVTDLDLNFIEDAAPYIGPRIKEDSEFDYFRSRTPVYTRPVSGAPSTLWLEVAIVADNSVTKFHGKDTYYYILALMNIVSAIFNDSSLGSNMTLVMTSHQLLFEEDPIINKYDNIKKKLESVNKWNHRRLNRLPADTNGWDATIWLTRTALDGPSGLAAINGVCTKTKSAALIHDEGLTSAFIIAHELGHLLGLNHDEIEPNKPKRGYIMATTVYSTFHKFAWSASSKKQFHENAKTWWCIHERSTDKGVILGDAKELSEYVLTMDQQCRSEYGEGFSVCNASECNLLRCAHKSDPMGCFAKSAPPKEGTPCGDHHWCVDRVCEPMPDYVVISNDSMTNSAAKPLWTGWDSWTDCDVRCGYGLRTRSRQCRKGETMSEDCEGSKDEAKTCWSGRECPAQRDVRTIFCRRRSNGHIAYWPTEDSKHCEIWCVDYKGGKPETLGSLPNGTPCSYARPYDLCFQGECVKGSCSESDPMCNFCRDGYCTNNTYHFLKKMRTVPAWTRITVIPHKANNLAIRIATPIAIKILVREKGKRRTIDLSKHVTKKYELQQLEDNSIRYDPNVPQNLQIIELDSDKFKELVEERTNGVEGEIIVAGILLKWKQMPNEVFLSSESMVQSDLMIMGERRHLDKNEDDEVLEVSVNFSTRSVPMEYGYMERGPCSAPCGGGQRWVKTRCSGSYGNECINSESCNTHQCEFGWVAAEWEQCSKTCGAGGVQQRQLYCIPTAFSGKRTRRELIGASVSPARCPASQPPKEQPCNRVPCPVYWEELPWTPCSATCGRGISRKPVICPAEDDLLCGPKPPERKKRCRLRRCPPPTTPAPCRGTDNRCEFFSTEELTRHCVVPRFRQYCCNACRENDIHRIYRLEYG